MRDKTVENILFEKMSTITYSVLGVLRNIVKDHLVRISLLV
jgi:hypothetical protein